jgi:hypothetical protein
VNRSAFVLVAAVSAMCGCAPNLAQQAKPPEFDRPGEAKCGVHKSQTEPLVVEWPSGARAKLEALSRTGVVAVRYTGCEMEVLASCNAPGKYAYTGITPKHDHVAIRNEDDLYANIPLGAAKLEGKLERAGELDVDMSIVGRYAADRTSVAPGDLQGPDCSKATHIVSALTVGAFDFSAAAGSTTAGGAGIGNAGAGGSTSSKKETLNTDGTLSACDAARTTDKAPPESCGAIIRLEVVPLGEAKAAAPVAPKPGAGDNAAAAATLGAGGEVEISVPDKDFTFQASVQAGGQTYACKEDVTYYKSCRLTGLPEGRAHVSVTGSSKFEKDFPVSADGRTSLQILHRGSGAETGMAVMTGIGAAATVFGLVFDGGVQAGSGCADTQTTGCNQNASDASFIANILMVSLGGSLVLLGLPGMIAGFASAHDAVMIQAPNKVPEMASGPHFTWGGPLEPTTFHF